MRFQTWILGFALSLLTLPCVADRLIIEPDMGRDPIINALNEAQSNVQLVMYGLTDTRLINTLIQTKNRGKYVAVLLEPSPYRTPDENTLAINRLKTANVDVLIPNPDFTLTHQKTLIVDGKSAVIMTFNFTHATFDKERNFGLMITDPDMIREIQAVFAADAKHEAIKVKNPNLVWSPNNSREKILSFIESAHSNIQIYAEGLQDYQVIGALANAARSGVKVQILMSTYGNPNRARKQINFLTRAGIQVQFSNQYEIHAKVIIVDQNRALLGSINLTNPSINKNRELSIFVKEPRIIAELEQTFAEDWGQTHAAARKVRKRDPNIALAKQLKSLLREFARA